MKNKDIGFLQQHLEKIVLGVAVLFALVVVALYYLGNPYAVSVGGRDGVSPDEVMDVVLQRAKRLEQEVNKPDSPLPATPVPPYTREFVTRSNRLPLSEARFASPIGRTGIDQNAFDIDIEVRTVELPPIPAPRDVVARAGQDVLVEQVDPQITNELIQLIGDRQPRDFPYVSAQATFSIEDLENAFLAIPADRRVPERYWKGRLALTAVELQRQMFDPVTGAWGAMVDGSFKPDAVETVPPLPYQRRYGIEPVKLEGAQAQQLVEQIVLEQELIAQPPFPQVAGVWTPPGTDLRQLSNEDRQRLLRLQEEIKMLRRLIKQREDRMLQQQGGGEQPGRPVRPRPAGRPPTPGEEALLDGIGPAGPGGPPGAGATEAELTQLRQRLSERLTEFYRLSGHEPANGVEDGIPGGFPGMTPGGFDPETGEPIFDPYGRPLRSSPGVRPGPAMSRPGMPPMGMPGGPGDPTVRPEMPRQVALYGHDLTVQRGRQYRYRFIVHVLNPLYQRGGLSDEQQQAYFDKLALASAPSPWSEPVEVEPEIRFFLVGTRGSAAEVEVWRIFNGQPQNRVFTVRPGEQIGDVINLAVGDIEQPVSMQVPALVVDLRESGGGLVGSTYELLYVDLESGQLKVRTLAGDLNDPNLIRLRSEKAMSTMAMQP